MEKLNTAFMLLAVGMGTVFAILLIIIYFSKLLILLVNRFAPDEGVNIGRNSIKPTEPEVTETVDKVIHKAVAEIAKGMKISRITRIK